MPEQPLCEILLYLTDKMAVCEYLEVKEMLNLKSTCVFENESAHLVTDKMIRKRNILNLEIKLKKLNADLEELYTDINKLDGWPNYMVHGYMERWIKIQTEIFIQNFPNMKKHEQARWERDKDRFIELNKSAIDGALWGDARSLHFKIYVYLCFKKHLNTDAGKEEFLTLTETNAKVIAEYLIRGFMYL